MHDEGAAQYDTRIIVWLLSWARVLIAFATISVPRFIYAVLSYSLTFTVSGSMDGMLWEPTLTSWTQLNFWSFVIIFVTSAVALNYWIRFRYLNTYATLKEPPLLKTDAKELHPDVNTTDGPPNFHNYLDDFLQAVRIFGFLEKPVCVALSTISNAEFGAISAGIPRVGQAFADSAAHRWRQHFPRSGQELLLRRGWPCSSLHEVQ